MIVISDLARSRGDIARLRYVPERLEFPVPHGLAVLRRDRLSGGTAAGLAAGEHIKTVKDARPSMKPVSARERWTTHVDFLALGSFLFLFYAIIVALFVHLSSAIFAPSLRAAEHILHQFVCNFSLPHTAFYRFTQV